MNESKSWWDKLFKPKTSSFISSEIRAKKIEFPTDLCTRSTLFQYLNFNIPDLQPVKLALEFGKEEKAFEQFLTYLKTRTSPSFMCSWWKREDIIQTLKTHYTESVPALLEAADNILQHKLLLFSSYPIQADRSICWSKSYEEGSDVDDELWKPGKKYTPSKLLEDTHHDIRFVWELNRHQYFLDLGKAYWYTGHEEYTEEFMGAIQSWIEQNPYPLSVNWAHHYEIALRGLFWLFGYTFFFSSELIDEQFFCRFYQMLLYHGHAIYNSLQMHSKLMIPAHHTVAQASFLYLIGTMFPEYLHSKIWSTLGWNILQWNSPLLTLDALLQSSLSSLIRATELYCMVLIVRKNNRYHVPQVINDGLTTLLNRLLLFIKPNGTFCGFGETPLRQLLTGMYHQSKDFRYLFSMAALLLKDTTLAAIGKRFEVSLLWFFGNEGLQNFEDLSTTFPEHQSCLVPSSHYAVMRNGWDESSSCCFISSGSDVLPSSALLQHSDLLSIELAANGQEYLIDSGPYSFHPTEEWNRYFRSIQAHNIITVDRITHMNFRDRQIKSIFDRWLTTPIFDVLSGYHNGFEDLEEPITHRRSIFYHKPSYWILCDLLTGEGQHFFDQYFHFPPFRLNVDFSNKRVDIRTDQHHHFTLMPINPKEMDVAIFTGGESPDSGWISNGYKQSIEASFIKYGKQTIAPVSFHTLLYAYHSENRLSFSGRNLQVLSQNTPLLAHEVSALEILCGQETHYFVLLYDQKHHDIQLENFTFSGTLFFLRRRENVIKEILLYNATSLTMGDITLFQSDTPVEHLALQLEEQSLYITCSGNYTFRVQFPEISQIFVNKRKAFLKYDQEMIFVSTTRV